MSDEGPKLFDHKPKKSKLKAARTVSPAAGATAPPPPPPPPLQQPPPPPPPPPPAAPPVKFYKGLAVVVSLVAGAYVFARTVLKVGTQKEEKPEDLIPTTSTSSSTTDTAVAITGQPVTPPTVVEPIQRPPIPEAQQRELLKWILEEKRKAKPRDADEKKRIDEEKAVLKQLIKSKSIPTI